MAVKVTDNTVNIKMDLTQKANIFLRLFADEIVTLSEPNTPKKQGNLRRDVLKSVLGLKGTVKWQKRYAAIQEKKQFRNYTTPGTGPHYARNAVNSALSRVNVIARRAGLAK
jgi:hypothetical protein